MNSEVQLVVVGSGAAGLTTALAAQTNGVQVLVLEKADALGGATAISGGGLWLPNSHPLERAGRTTDQEALLRYLTRLSGGRTRREFLECFLETAPEVARFLESHTPIRFQYTRGYPDYHPEWEGGSAEGRMIEPEPLPAEDLSVGTGEVLDRPYANLPSTMSEWVECGSPSLFSIRADLETLIERAENDVLTQGRALIAGLYEACRKAGVQVRTDSPVERLLLDQNSVLGVETRLEGTPARIEADAVMIAAGGMDWDEGMCEQFLAGPLDAPAGPPDVEGDALRMGMDAGAKMSNMNEAWWFPTVSIPGEQWPDGSPVHRLVHGLRSLPGSVVVNAKGRRFVNGSANYNDVGKAFREFDIHDYGYRNVPAYSVMDASYRERYPIVTCKPGEPDPDWVTVADSLLALADRLGMPEDSLSETIDAFNRNAQRGVDPDYHRGESAYDRFYGDPDAEHPNLGPVSAPPFYAVELKPGALGTKGGMATNVHGQVLDPYDSPIEGLYAAGNSMAQPMGIGYPGGGGTLGPICLFAYRSGLHVAEALG